MDDRRARPWKKLRVVVEVTVPPNCRATEKDLMHEVKIRFGSEPRVQLPRPHHDNHHVSVVRFKTLTAFWPLFLRKERGLSVGTKKTKDDPYRGL